MIFRIHSRFSSFKAEKNEEDEDDHEQAKRKMDQDSSPKDPDDPDGAPGAGKSPLFSNYIPKLTVNKSESRKKKMGKKPSSYLKHLKSFCLI